MEFNKVIRNAKREHNDEASVVDILDAGFLCHVSFQHEGQVMMIPTAYGRKDDSLYLHGSAKNFMLNQILDGQTVCISVTHLDGIVLARSLFHTSVNYRSVVLFGKAILVEDEAERIEGLKVISEHIVKGRYDEVPLGTEAELKATMVIKFQIEKASAKIRDGGPIADEDIDVDIWSGQIPVAMKALSPIPDLKFGKEFDLSPSVASYLKRN